MTDLENRRAHRYPVDVSAEVSVGARTLPMRTKNLSETGVCLVGRTPLDEGGELKLNLFLTVDGIEDPDTPPLELGASVIWATPGNENDHLAGCHFSDLDGDKVSVLKDFLGRIR